VAAVSVVWWVSCGFAGALPGGDVVDLFAVAAAQAARTGWAKVIADWYPEDEPVPVGVLAAVVEAGLPGTSRSLRRGAWKRIQQAVDRGVKETRSV
jgi:hypothetical protein